LRAEIIVGSDRLQQWLLRIGLILSAVLLIRFAIDFSQRMRWWLAAPFCLLVFGALVVATHNVFGSVTPQLSKETRLRRFERELLLAAIPLSFFASSLGCSGLSAAGCTPFCTFTKLIWIPLIALACGIYLLAPSQGWLTTVCVMSFVPLFPHCVCSNVGNAWWIDRIGASPVCYAWGFAVSVTAIGALRRGANSLRSLAVCYVVIAGATGFFVSHHYYHFPW
jgi:hypothetical protein